MPDEHLEQADLDGPAGLHVTVRWATGTGQYHCARQLMITTPGGVLRLESPYLHGIPEEDAPDGSRAQGDGGMYPLYPLLERVLVAGLHRWVILGWSSFGEGLQTEHAWLIEDRPGPMLVDALTWTTDRSHGGLAIERSKTPLEVRIGIPLPDEPRPSEPERTEGSDGPPPLHLPGDWELVHGKQRWDLSELRRLPSVERRVKSLSAYYDPPFQDAPSRLHWAGRFVWFSAQHQFTLMQPGRH